jgi:cysteinyl-tRNA synthetase
MNANLVNASYPGLFSVEPPYEIDPFALAHLDNLIAWAEEADIFVVIHFRTGPGRSESAIHMEPGAITNVWTDPEAQVAFIEMWRFTAERYKNSPVVVGYDLMVEPLANLIADPEFELDASEYQAAVEGTLMDWNALAEKITSEIRSVDTETPIIVSSLGWADPEWFEVLEPTGDGKTIYSFHAYEPGEYTHQEADEIRYSYPDVIRDSGDTFEFNLQALEEHMSVVVDFATRHNVPIYVGEFGAMRWVPNGGIFLRDEIEIFEKNGWNYAYYVWRGDEPDFDGFNLEYGSDPDQHTAVIDNPLISLITSRWRENIDFPSNLFRSETPASLEDVKTWLYILDVNLSQDMVSQITTSTYDMVVIDFITSEENNTDYPLDEVVHQLQTQGRQRIVLAYIDIGEAEDYRTYWNPDWQIGDPEWIIGLDPDGWEGNYPVAYWWEEYREIWLAENGYLQGILDAGFDGVYLDWVEAYSDENVVAFAEADGVDPRQEMIRWVGDIADFGRQRDPDFLVIAQNAAELAQNDGYVEIIDAIAQEQTWFDGGADNEPQGDCPLPATDEDLDTNAYYESLSRVCQKQYDEFPDSTLHVSSAEYLQYLTLAQNKGLTIFTVDYAVQPENIDWVYKTSRNLDFIPFVSNRALNLFLSAVP